MKATARLLFHLPSSLHLQSDITLQTSINHEAAFKELFILSIHSISHLVKESDAQSINYVSAYVSVQFWILNFIKSLIQVGFLASNIWLLSSIFPLCLLLNPNLQHELPCLFLLTVVKFCVQLVLIIRAVLDMSQIDLTHMMKPLVKQNR